MSVALIGLYASFAVLVCLSLLFSYEKRRGVRFFEFTRVRMDFFVLTWTRRIHRVSHYVGGVFIRQVAHYLFHSLLRSILELTRRAEHGLRNIMRINKTLAKRAERESDTRTKLEEVALHKAAHALTEDEKRIRKAKMLQGHPHQ